MDIFKSKVRLSAYSSIVTLAVAGLLLWLCITSYGHTRTFLSVALIFSVLLFAALLCAPLRVEAGEKEITVRSALKRHRIPLKQVADAEEYRPTMGANSLATYRFRVFASGGFMGYWGVFYDGDIGRYAAYFGKASDCILLRMKNGDKYVIGCADRDEMLSYIKEMLGSRR